MLTKNKERLGMQLFVEFRGHFGTNPRDVGNFCDWSLLFDDFGLML
jgi:hypothetical protein